MATDSIAAKQGSASRWGPLWGARPEDWAISEDQQLPTYEEALRHVGLEPGERVLDVGCGVGTFLRLVAERGGEPFGIDASERLIEDPASCPRGSSFADDGEVAHTRAIR